MAAYDTGFLGIGGWGGAAEGQSANLRNFAGGAFGYGGPSPDQQAFLQWFDSLPHDVRASMYKDWQASKGMGTQAEQQLLQAWKRQYTTDPSRLAQAAAQKNSAELQKFINMLKGDVRQDPVAQGLSAMGATVGGHSAALRGVGGPMAGTAAVAGSSNALLPYMQQRQSMLQQAIAQQAGQNNNLEQLRMGWTNMQNQQAMQRWAGEQNQAQGIGGLLGGIAGGALAAGTGNLAALPQFASAGAQLGGSVGGMVGGGGASPQSFTSRSPVSYY